jgi:4-carboxymuconolactone decarboxylase
MNTQTSPHSKLPLVEMPDDPAARDMFEKLSAQKRLLNLHRMMAHAPPQLLASYETAMAFRNDTKLPRVLVELVILRTAQVIDCAYEWDRHVPHARACGISEQQMAEINRWRESAAFTPREKAALGFAEKAAKQTPIDDASFAEMRKNFSAREIVEITMLVGFYVSTAILIKALGVPDESN